MTTRNSPTSNIEHSAPIPIAVRTPTRRRSASEASDNSSPDSVESESPKSYSPETPYSSSSTSKPAVSPITSPILSYFYGATPAKSPPSFGVSPPANNVFVEDDEAPGLPELPASPQGRMRRLSTSWMPPRFPSQTAVTDAQKADKGTALMRRLSLGSAFSAKPAPGSSNSPPSETTFKLREPPENSPRRHMHRKAATLSAGAPDPKVRAPSPMGERMLKGHYDGF